MTALILVLSAVIGAAMGLTGIGGFLVVPLMMALAGASAPQAVLVALTANLGVAVLNGLISVRRRQVEWRVLRLLVVGSGIGLLGAFWLVGALSQESSRFFVAAFLTIVGIATLAGSRRVVRPPGDIARGATGLVALGALAQLGASVVGLGGPAITVPTLAARSGASPSIVGTAIVHGAVVSSLGILVARGAGAAVDAWVIVVPVVIVAFSLATGAARGALLRALDVRPAVGVLSLLGAAVLLVSR